MCNVLNVDLYYANELHDDLFLAMLTFYSPSKCTSNAYTLHLLSLV